MKFSLKVQDQPQNHQSTTHNHHPPLLLRAKLPITVFGLPFLSEAAATDSSDLSLSLRTNFLSGPSLKLTYTPTTTTTTNNTCSAATSPITVTLRSGVGLFGSPHNSPLVISAHFSLSPQNPNPTPTFSLQIKPRFGDFSLLKTTRSPPNPRKPNGEVLGFVPLERPTTWKDLNLDSTSKHSILSGVLVTARTNLPVTKSVAVNCRWGVNFPADIRKNLPFLTVNKIGIERVCDVKEVEESKKKKSEGNVSDLELLKGLCVSVSREVEVLQKENRGMKQRLEEMRFGKYDGGGKKMVGVSESGGEFEPWKSKRSGGGGGGGEVRESKKSVNRASDVESELQRAIKAASS